MKRILVATDGSPPAAHAVAFGVELAAQERATVEFVHVVPPASTDAFLPSSTPDDPGRVGDQPLDAALRYAATHAVGARAKVLHGDTVDEVVAYGDSLDVDLIVLGSRGRGVFSSALLGSTSRGVIAESRRPILIVRGGLASIAPTAALVAG